MFYPFPPDIDPDDPEFRRSALAGTLVGLVALVIVLGVAYLLFG